MAAGRPVLSSSDDIFLSPEVSRIITSQRVSRSRVQASPADITVPRHETYTPRSLAQGHDRALFSLGLFPPAAPHRCLLPPWAPPSPSGPGKTIFFFSIIFYFRQRKRACKQGRGAEGQGERENPIQAPRSGQSPMQGSSSRPWDHDLS